MGKGSGIWLASTSLHAHFFGEEHEGLADLELLLLTNQIQYIYIYIYIYILTHLVAVTLIYNVFTI
jgi:hypothetical protein